MNLLVNSIRDAAKVSVQMMNATSIIQRHLTCLERDARL
jgi:hypothetical protein